MASEEGHTDSGLDSADLAHTTQIAKKAKNVDAADVTRVDIGYGSLASSSKDPIEELGIQASDTEEERVGEYDANINNDYDINSERASDDVVASLLVGEESQARRQNLILKKLLRAPRYFDCPESTRLANELSEDDNEGTANKGHKSCYICGDIDHSGNNCKKANACIVCSGKGHLMKDCPNKNSELDSTPTPCLRCGNTDHDMFSCTQNYDPEDLKAIECYICKQPGHLCCLDNKEEGPNKASCYRCGQPGHFGLECTKSNIPPFDFQLFCRKCKERGHSSTQCPPKQRLQRKARSAKKIERTRLFFARKNRRKKPEQAPAPLLAGAASCSGSTAHVQP
ncbi:DNA-binding protein HEXBP-like [Salvia splendens]|uniref:DNA-binding protein HEXBP-like n=1 Tax=Salvia splendens TaxID=180675 RepID=UPI001C253B6A|nr:DNA-binding protein HEXBP-like [Salvia splendens]